ncbi:MAG: tRNA (adenosine(37)-N6)-threonylcarbamoyltransferase complex ATPase subunit type 1 TsaE [Cyclobacteriaceae bacterium]|nr:tRNA (adenosine(37)-N6)-threonylcarbamoyltransferase complex ATPase subunit type 1 TsaE [Cyclobacteriaceae bacterium]
MHPDLREAIYEHVALHDLERVADKLLQEAGEVKIWIFSGEMGSGKTTLIKALCSLLGVSDAMSSPTFSIVNEYQTNTDQQIYHFDFYRIKNETEAWDIGIDEYLYSGNYCFIEWPEKIPSLIPARHVSVMLTQESNVERTIALSLHDGEKENRI